jgi:hypothetical protein
MQSVQSVSRPHITFHYVSEARSWEAARTYCRDTFQGELASIVDAAENTQVLGLLPNQYAWFGLLREANNDPDFLWTDGTPRTYTNWANQEPNNTNQGENCVHMYDSNVLGGSLAGKWNDLHCAALHAFVCAVSVS